MAGHLATPTETSPDKSSNRPRTPAASTLRPLDDHGLRRALPARPGRPAFYAVRVPRVAGSPPASFPPHLAVTRLPSACGWGHLLHGGLTPPSCCPCRAYKARGRLGRPLDRERRVLREFGGLAESLAGARAWSRSLSHFQQRATLATRAARPAEPTGPCGRLDQWLGGATRSGRGIQRTFTA